MQNNSQYYSDYSVYKTKKMYSNLIMKNHLI